LKLYFSPGACSLATHIVLRESRTPFSLEKVDTGAHVTRAGTDYYTINPKGQVPLLQLDDCSRLSEGPFIAQYIADTAKQATLMPPDLALIREARSASSSSAAFSLPISKKT